MTLLNALLPCFLLSLPAHAADPGPLSARVEAVASPEPGADAVIAYLGRRVIRYGDFSAWLQRMEGPRAKRLRANPDSRAQAVRQFLDLQVLAAKGRLEQVQRTRAFRSQFALAEQQCCVKVLLDEDRPGSDGQKLKAEAEAPTETELQACFADHRERFAIPERFTVRQILVRLKGGLGAKGGGLPEPEARAKLGYIQEALKAGQSFEALARDYSDDPGSRANGGLYQDIPFGRFPRAFEAAVRAQAIGEVGPPVRTLFGYHLIRVEARYPGAPATFEQARAAVREAMLPERRKRLEKEFMDQARRDMGFRPAGIWARIAWEDQRLWSLQQAREGDLVPEPPPPPTWLGGLNPGSDH